MSNRAIFLDRDDTLIKDVPYSGDITLVELLPNVREALEMLKNHGFCLFMVSNQSGVGRGLITAEQVHAVNQEILRQLGKNYFKDIYLCFSVPGQDDEGCRKPNPGMIWRARDEHDLDLAASFLIGDKPSDIFCAQNAGCRSVLLLTGTHGENLDDAKKAADFFADDLLQAAEWICRDSNIT
ncbi:HAD-IIIA family hydrolase [candidate division KSB1 bacterium]|nr:HAD-IIIA family hydrolase [candidate division KSB1 bacterium]